MISARRAAKQTLFQLGYYQQRLSQMAFPGVAALCYHGIRGRGDGSVPFADLHVDTAVFEAHCRLIAASCDPISLDDLRDARAGRRPLPKRPVLVTFDDGYRSVLDRALPVLERHGLPAVVFVCAEPVLRSRQFWFDTLCNRDGETAVLNAATLPYEEWRALRDSLSTTASADEIHRPMTPAELRRVADSPLIEIGGHTVSHPSLACAGLEMQREEISDCRTALQQLLGSDVRSFAYPFGKRGPHYTTETVAAVRHAGFDVAFTTQPSFVGTDADAFELPRFVMLDAVDDVELAHRLSHSWHTSD